MGNETANGYSSGAEMWRDNAASYGVITARIICSRYLDLQAQTTDESEREFCRELREAMALERNFAGVDVYLHSKRLAELNDEMELYYESGRINSLCAGDIESAIKACKYGDGTHDYKYAFDTLVEQYGTDRVSFVLAAEAEWRGFIGIVSKDIYDWARGFGLRDDFYDGVHLRMLPDTLSEFISYIRDNRGIHGEKLTALGQPEAMQLYTNGAEFWHDLTQTSVNMEAALQTGGNIIGAMMKHKCSRAETRLCRELFTSMYETTASKTDPGKLVYAYNYQKANERGETAYYSKSRRLNTLCARAIKDAILYSRNAPNSYNFELAAMKVIHEYGFDRVNLTLASNLQPLFREGQDMDSSIKWARGIAVPDTAFSGAVIDLHPSLLQGFTTHARKVYDLADAGRFVLPGRSENGMIANGYEILRVIAFDDQCGFAMGINAKAEQPFATWQFTAENGKREYYGAHFSNDFTDAAANYNARIIAHMNGGNVKEIPAAITEPTRRTAEHEPTAPLTEEKPSVLKQIKDAQSAQKAPHKVKTPQQHKNKNGIEH